MPKKAGNPKFVKMSWDEWSEKFKPLQSRDGEDLWFETYGGELAIVELFAKYEPGRVWTHVEGDSGKDLLTEGMHYVNRVRYYITEIPAPPGIQYEVAFD